MSWGRGRGNTLDGVPVQCRAHTMHYWQSGVAHSPNCIFCERKVDYPAQHIGNMQTTHRQSGGGGGAGFKLPALEV